MHTAESQPHEDGPGEPEAEGRRPRTRPSHTPPESADHGQRAAAHDPRYLATLALAALGIVYGDIG
ncbi:MAG TPA: hypothetical protein VHQ45_14490, partial [Gemmatimonadaceae bacterium]|nr:hypothetical protein [Gemmatimonadaceae bacterium]